MAHLPEPLSSANWEKDENRASIRRKSKEDVPSEGGELLSKSEPLDKVWCD